MNNATEASNLERLKLALASACMGTWEWNPETGAMTWDERMRGLFGVTEFSERYTDFLQLIHPEDRSEIGAEFARTKAGGIDAEFRVIWPADGSEHLLRMRSNASCDKETCRIIGVAWDITERHRTEMALKREGNLLRSVINNIPDPIFVKNARGEYILDNRAHRQKLGITRENDVIGKDAFAFFSEATARNFQQIDSQILKTGEPLLDYEEEAIGPDGNRRWLLTTKVPLRDDAGDVLICINRDITEKKIAADRLAQLAAELRAKNEALQEDLEMARELQSALLPQRFPHFPHHATDENSAVHFYPFFRPSMVVSGDFFDVLDISDDKAGLFICDVMGHGVRAALVAATIRALVIELRPMWTDPGRFITELNRALIEALKNSNITLFASAFYVMADLEKGDLCFANAGHPAPIRVVRGDIAAVPSSLNGGRPGPALGLIDSAAYATKRCQLSPHDLLLLFTDGLFEVEGSGGRLYDYQELSKAVGRHNRLPPTELCKSLIEEVQQFSATREFNDDVCLVAMDIERLREH